MRHLVAYMAWCAVVIALFSYGQFFGRSLFDDMPNQPASRSGGSGGGGSGFFYTGSSGGSHK